MKNICITGANGFIGKSICKSLNNSDKYVRAFSRNKNLTISSNNIEFVKIEDFFNTNWKDLVFGFDCIVHCAGRVPSNHEKSKLDTYRSINIDGTSYLAKQCAAANVKRFIFLSSINVLGSKTNDNEPFLYNDKPKPITDYGLSKLEAEQELKKISQETGLEVVIIRPPIVYGPSATGNLERLIKLVNSGIPLPFKNVRNQRSLIGISNLVDVIKCCIENPNAAGKTFLVSDGDDLSTPELINFIAYAMGRSSRLFSIPKIFLKIIGKFINKENEMDRLLGSLQVDIDYTCKVLNWKPSAKVAEEIKRMVQHNDSHI